MGQKAKKGSTLTLKQLRFIDAYLGTANGNATQAMRMAGYKGNSKTLQVTGAQNLRKPIVRAEIERRQGARTAKAILDADQRDELLSEWALRKGARLQDRISAVKELNRVTGRHSLTLNHKGKIALEDALEAAQS